MQEALQELSIWLDAHPQEIIIISCSHFESLSDEDHTGLVEFILVLFGQKLCAPKVSRLIDDSSYAPVSDGLN